MATDTFVVTAGKPTILKDPNAVLDYTMSWAAWLVAAGNDTIASVVSVGDAVTVNSTTNNATTVTIWVSGGTVGVRGSVRVRITTVGGRTDDRTVYFKIKER